MAYTLGASPITWELGAQFGICNIIVIEKQGHMYPPSEHPPERESQKRRWHLDLQSLCLWTILAACLFFLALAQGEPLACLLVYFWIALIACTRVLFGWIPSLAVSGIFGAALLFIAFLPREPPRGTRVGAAIFGCLVGLLMVLVFALCCRIVRFLRKLLDAATRFMRQRKQGE